MAKEREIGFRFRTPKGVYIIVGRSKFNKSLEATEYSFVQVLNPTVISREEFDRLTEDKYITL
jgi:hypothetical protein